MIYETGKRNCDRQAGDFRTARFSALRREVFEQNDDGTPSDVVKERTYDLKSKTQRRMIQVSIPASVPLRDYEYNAEVDIVNPVANTVANATFATMQMQTGISRRTISCW